MPNGKALTLFFHVKKDGLHILLINIVSHNILHVGIVLDINLCIDIILEDK